MIVKNTPDFDILVDDREKMPWNLAKNCKYIQHSTVARLLVGDYTIVGLEDRLCIERKRTATEFANNVFDKNFRLELERMQKFLYRFIIFEFDLQNIIDFPAGSSIPAEKLAQVRVTGQYMMRFISEIETVYHIPVLICGSESNARFMVANIMRRVAEECLITS